MALSLSKAEGNLKFLKFADSATITQADAVEDALKAVQEARKLFKQICREKNSWQFTKNPLDYTYDSSTNNEPH